MTTGASNVSAAAIVLVALVADDPAILRNAPRDDAPAQSTLWRGDWLEVRGEAAGFLGCTTTATSAPATSARPSYGCIASSRRARRSWPRWFAS